MTGRLAGKLAFITGGASGIGKATAQLFAQEGANVIVSDIDRALGEATVAEIKQQNGRAEFVILNVAQEEAWEKTLNDVRDQYGQFDILLNNAGITIAKPITEIKYSEWRHLMSINLDGTFLGTKHAVRIMRALKGGSIINMSSVSGLVASPLASAYGASKSAIRLLTKSVALECANLQHPIRVNSIHPGAVDTPIWNKADWWHDYVQQMGSEEKAWASISQSTPMGRVAQAIEIAKAILFLASDDASFVTGSELVVDGGFTAQ